MSRLDKDDLKQIVHELSDGLQKSVPKDSFNIFRSNLRQDWVFIVAIAGVALWLVNGINDGKNSDNLQNTLITANKEDIATLTSNISALTQNIQSQNTTQQTTNSQILSKIELIQKDIEIIKNK